MSGSGEKKIRAGWTAAKEAVFFRELATVCNVSSALRACGMFRRSRDVYDRRRAEPAFRARWEAAVDEGYALLDLEMLERARFGNNRPPPTTEAEKRLREVPTALGLQLLKLYHARKAKAPPAPAARAAARRIDGAALRREFDALLSDFNRRMGGKG
ncbi:MAG: hypothetical protein WBR13_13290 [Allosphingosinicella sp.]